MRIKRGNVCRNRHKKILKLAKGFKGARSRIFKVANIAVMKALKYAYRDRRATKRNMRRLWIVRINAAVREQGMSYSRFVNACKKANGYSKAWLHHKGRNSHHYEYWQDNFDRGGEALQMPFEDALELICDYLAAGRAYGSNFTYSGEYQWWKSKTANPIAMHPQTKLFVEYMLSDMAKEESSRCLHPFSASRKYHFAEYVIKTGG